jgi:four helix bundle protein
MARERTYRDLVAWQKGRLLVAAVYRMMSEWRADERFGLDSQVRRAAVSVPSNIAEGQGRLGSAELRHHLSIAHGSLCELETLLYDAGDVGLVDEETQMLLLDQTDEVGRLL